MKEEKGNCTCVQANPARLQNSLSTEELDEIRKDYEEWAVNAENAASYKTENDYPGY